MVQMRLLFVLFVSIVCVFPLASVRAQQDSNPFGTRGAIGDQELYRPPEVFILKAAITKQENRRVEGVATFWNKESAIVGGLTYRIDLLGALPIPNEKHSVIEDNAPVYDERVSPDSFVLLGGEKRDVLFSYTAPESLPAGEYRIEITASTIRGRTMGWYDIPVTFKGETRPFVQLYPQHIVVPEYSDSTFQPGSGPNVGPGNKLRITAQTDSSNTIRVVPTLDIYRFNVGRDKVQTVTGTPTLVRADHNQDIVDVGFTASRQPGVYFGILSLRDATDGQQVSNLGEYRWVVRGEDADILHVRMDTDGFQRGNVWNLIIDYAGAPDAETKVTGRLFLALQDDDGIAGDLNVSDIVLTDQIATGTGNVVLRRSLGSNASVLIRIAMQDGTELVKYDIPLNVTEAQRKKLENGQIISQALLYGGTVVVLLGAGVIGLSMYRNQGKKKRIKKSKNSFV